MSAPKEKSTAQLLQDIRKAIDRAEQDLDNGGDVENSTMLLCEAVDALLASERNPIKRVDQGRQMGVASTRAQMDWLQMCSQVIEIERVQRHPDRDRLQAVVNKGLKFRKG